MSDKPALGERIVRLPWYTVPAILVGVPLLAVLVGKLVPAFMDHVLWRYYWGPIAAEAARDTHVLVRNGVAAEAGYNLVNTLSWAVLLGLVLVGVVQLLTRLRARFTTLVVWGGAAWVVAGAVWHVLQDAGLFVPPLEYIFITPPIYLLFAAGGLVSFVFAIHMRRVSQAAGIERALRDLWLALTFIVLLYTLAWLTDWSQVQHYVGPVAVALLAALTFFVVRWRVLRQGRVEPGEMLILLALFPFLLAVMYVRLFLEDRWMPASYEPMPVALLLAPLLAALIAAGVYFLAHWRARGGSQGAVAFTWPVNLAIIFSQVTDALSTGFGVELRGMTEKHVLSRYLIEDFFRANAARIGWDFGVTYATFLIFVPVKFLVALLVVWAIDVYSKEDARRYPTLIGLVKLAVIMVGLGPGVRNLVRLSLGV